ESCAEREVVDLDDDAIGVEVERLPLPAPLAAERDDLVDGRAAPPVPLDRQPPGCQRFERLGVCRDVMRDGLKTVPYRRLVGDAFQGVARNGVPTVRDDLIGERRQ